MLRRVIRIRKVVSKEIQAYRGITAGSGSAVTEMKLVMISIILKTMMVLPMVIPSCFMDDLFVEMIGPDHRIEEDLAGFIQDIAKSFRGDELELSKIKCVCSASTVTLGKKLEKKWKGLEIFFHVGVKSLIVGLRVGCSEITK